MEKLTEDELRVMEKSQSSWQTAAAEPAGVLDAVGNWHTCQRNHPAIKWVQGEECPVCLLSELYREAVTEGIKAPAEPAGDRKYVPPEPLSGGSDATCKCPRDDEFMYHVHDCEKRRRPAAEPAGEPDREVPSTDGKPWRWKCGKCGTVHANTWTFCLTCNKAAYDRGFRDGKAAAEPAGWHTCNRGHQTVKWRDDGHCPICAMAQVVQDHVGAAK